ncbi:cellulase family glycosylhydrolase [Laceyella putida]|uniref:Exo-1,3-beta-glucanase D n=1 Tax=Laceyella putida TaxID=110101 RepID=A0ABW2RP40_9BACL
MLKKSLLSALCFVLLIGLFLGLPSASKVNAAINSDDFLKTNGKVIRDHFGTGAIVNLRGTNLGGWLLQENWMSPAGAADEYTVRQTLTSRFGESGAQSLLNSYQDTWIQASDLDNIKNLGMNAVRVPLYWEDFMYSNGTMKPDNITFRKLDWLVAEAGSRDIYVILDLHGAPGAACPWQSCGRENFNQLWTNATYQNWTVQIWERLATHYKGNPTVAAYDLLNEPLVTMGGAENAAQIQQKMQFYNRMYQAVRAKDPDHIIIIAAFFDWYAAYPPSTYGWTNVVYQTHHYNFTDYDNWDLTNSEINRWLADLSNFQLKWNVPVYAGEFSFGQNDLYEKWLAGLNALNASWTNWSYKVKGGGNWGYYHNNNNPTPNLSSDSAAVILDKWSKFSTAFFTPNTTFQNLVKKHTNTPPVTDTWYSIKASANNQYVSADNYGNNPLTANRNSVQAWEKFKIINNSDGTISLLSMANNKYVKADLNQQGKLIVSATDIQQWEKFNLVDLGNGTFALRALANNLYVCVDLNAGSPELIANRTSVGGAWEAFTIAVAP